jgi:hypothetical protein
MSDTDDDRVFDEFQQYCDEIAKAADAWEKRWPNACKSCYGRGGSSYVEMHGFKHGAGEQMWDSCRCVDDGNCPRCGVAMNNAEGDETIPCPNCKWNWGKDEDDACPEV